MSKSTLLVLATSLLTTSLAYAGAGTPGPPPYNYCAVGDPPSPALGSCTEGWHPAGFPQSNKAAHLTMLPEDCYWDSNAYLQCYFASAKEACDGAILMNNVIQKNGTQWGFKALETTSEADFVHCKVDSLDANGNPTGFVQDVALEYQNRPERGDFVQRVNFWTGTVTLYEPKGPYHNQPDTPYLFLGQTMTGKPYPGSEYGCLSKTMQNGTYDFRTMILGLNAARFNGHLVSDLAGYAYPKPASSACIKNHPTKAGFCIESDAPLQTAPNFPNSAQVHHEIPRKFNVSGKSCPWGRASMKNALVISAQLNLYFSNKYPEIDAVLRMNNTTPYPTFP